MKNPFVSAALVGTARQEPVPISTGTPLDPLLTALPQAEAEAEHQLLLSAGAWAVYQQAGRRPQKREAVPEPAGIEQLRECSPEAALLLSDLLGGEKTSLLPEALARLRLHGMRLPYRLLPQALNAGKTDLRAALFPVLGERGRWLSRFQPSWQWVQEYLPADETGLPADAETIWQEGTPGQRLEILRRQRAVDPEKARAWLESAWKQEKADFRCELLKVLEVGLAAADEPLLEKALDDRAASVRGAAVPLLSRLSDSAFSRRMCERGRQILYSTAGKLVIKLPTTFDTGWQRDGLSEKPPTRLGKRAWWLIQVLALTPPAFWEIHLGAEPARLIALVAGSEWEVPVIEGWSKATINYGSPAWIMSLWNWWKEYYRRESEQRQVLSDNTVQEQLLQQMPGPVAEQAMLNMLDQQQKTLPDGWWECLRVLPRPWSMEFAHVYLRLCRQHLVPQVIAAEDFHSYADPWLSSLQEVALALPPACFSEALQLWDLPTTESNWQIQYAARLLQEFTEIVQIRQKIDKEII